MYAPPLSCKETAGGDGSLAMPSQNVGKNKGCSFLAIWGIGAVVAATLRVLLAQR